MVVVGEVSIESATRQDLGELRSFYQAALGEAYASAIDATDQMYIARSGTRIIAAARLSREEGAAVLRGVEVLRDFHRRGIGLRLVSAAISSCTDDVYCIPYTHLDGFYRRLGFRRAASAPTFLMRRAASYTAEGASVFIAVRPGVVL